MIRLNCCVGHATGAKEGNRERNNSAAEVLKLTHDTAPLSVMQTETIVRFAVLGRIHYYSTLKHEDFLFRSGSVALGS